MPTFTALDAKNRFGQLIEMAQRSPVTITKNGRPSVVVMSAAQYERQHAIAVEQMLEAMKRLGDEARANGLTDEILDDLLRDES